MTLLPQTMHGRLCAPPGASTVVVLIPGGTYNASYWDIGYTPEIRSFRLAMNQAGVATLALDRLGTGGSSKPLSTLLSASAQAVAAHQVIQSIRPRFAKVVVGGHSIGAAMAMIEAGRYRDVDGVLVTGMTHRMNLVTVVPVLANMIPAPLDPALSARGLDAGYLTTGRGTRYKAFHTPGPLDAGAIAYDESTKDVFAATEAVDSLTLTTVITPASRGITAPVLLVVGNDPHFCGTLGSDCSSAEALRASEAPFFGTPSLKTYILGGYGHAINYAPNAPAYFGVVTNWLKTL
ncbi:alpha/beta hydrolase [Amycolatopsis sp. A133]|uniref:alpha/beta hydrolase n=1 Tax=Amycolatopsis sp. A133 TaxID=3064472 RepID=UPI0037C13233